MPKATTPPSRHSLERDLGLGTSGEEESSESSLSKKRARAAGKAEGPAYGMKELYSNEGYLSDDEGPRRAARPSPNRTPLKGPTSGGRSRSSSVPQGGEVPPHKHTSSSSPKRKGRGSYVCESKFP